jgi:hypothetical protein
MILTALEYSEQYRFRNKQVSSKTIIRRCKAGMMPYGHNPRKLPGKKGTWVIEISEGSVINSNIAKNYNIQITAKK